MDRIVSRTDRGGRAASAVLGAFAALILCASGGLQAQLISSVTQIPDTGKPPVVFLNGYQFGCIERPTFEGTFAIADQLLQRDSRPSLFFNNCDVGANLPIEDLGAAFGRYLESLRYTDGRPVPQVDVVAHSMGGMIVRAYLSGKGRERGVFQPPAQVRIRKAVLIAVPFLGSVTADLAFGTDTQASEMRVGSAFVFDLATWNQGTDDLRGIDAVALVGNGGTGVGSGTRGFDDSTVSVTAASLDFAQTGRTRVLPYCHTALTGLLSAACAGGALPIARMTSDQHDSARIMLSFLSGTSDWQNVGQSPASNEFLRDRGGVQLQYRNERDEILRLDSASAVGPGALSVRSAEIAWNENVPGRTALTVSATTSAGVVQRQITVPAGTVTAQVVKTAGPQISAVIPNFGDVRPRAVAPGSFISIYGASLAAAATPGAPPYPATLGGTEVRINNQPVGLQYAGPEQVNAVMPDIASGLVRLTVRNSSGERTVNLMVEPVVPTLFPTAVNTVTGALTGPANPAHPGEYISLYLTGLGATERRSDGLDWARQQPQVVVGGQPCAVQYAGRAPGYAGLDQINCQISATVPASDVTPVVVSSGNRSANAVIPVR